MSRKNALWKVVLILMPWTSLVVPASAQHFEQVTVKGGGTLAHVAAGRNEVFGLESSGAIWRYNSSTTSFDRIKGSLQQIAVGGGTRWQLDQIWGITRGEVYQFNYTTKVFDHISAPAISQIAVGEGVEDSCHPYEVWGVVAGSSINRYNYCSNSFEVIDTGAWTQVGTGGGTVWATEIQGTGGPAAPLIYDVALGGFLDVGEGVGNSLKQFAVGVNDMWAINSSNQIVQWDWNTSNGFVANVEIQGTLAQIAAGGDGVWGVAANSNEIFRLDESSDTFVQVPGALTSIAVGSGAGVWGVDSSGDVFTFVRP
jgi:hypothetical protein